MDIPSPPPTTATTTVTTATTATASPVKDPDHDHPDDPILFPKQLSTPFTNGVLKRHKPLHHHHNPPPVVVSYKECLKNHAASMGGHAVDGCGEFMPSPASTPTDPTSIKCAACGCHRNFHRRDPGGLSGLFVNNLPGSHAGSGSSHVVEYQPHHRHHPPPPLHPISVAGPTAISVAGPTATATDPSVAPVTEEPSGSGEDSPSPPPISSSYYPSAPHMLLTLSSGLSIPPREIGIGIGPSMPISTGVGIGSNSSGKKRFRTKFTQDQKEKMHELAERVGWKMQKKDEDLIIRICNEIGVDKGVFKVWMHNNKMTFGKKDSGNHHMIDSGSSGVGVDGLNFLIHRNNHHQNDHQQPNNDSGSSGGGNAIGTNGSSSSS